MDTVRGILRELLGTSIWEASAVLLSLAYLVLAMRRSLWCWLCAFISTAIYIVLMARTGLVMDTLLQVYYLVMAVYGYVQWRRGQTSSGEVAVVSWGLPQHLLAIIAVTLATIVNAWALQYAAPLFAKVADLLGTHYVQVVRSPWLDSLVTWGSVLTTWMVARRVLENWLYWIVFDSIGAYLYYSRGLVATAVLFIVYVAMVIQGYVLWRRRTTVLPITVVNAA